MSIDHKLREIRNFCRAHAAPARGRKYARCFVEGFDAYGLEQKGRAVPVSLIEPIQHGLSPAGPLKLSAPMMHDVERVVQRGLGWLLGETWKLHPNAAEKLLRAYKNTGPRLIIQYATEKMAPPQKARFEKSAPTASKSGQKSQRQPRVDRRRHPS